MVKSILYIFVVIAKKLLFCNALSRDGFDLLSFYVNKKAMRFWPSCCRLQTSNVFRRVGKRQLYVINVCKPQVEKIINWHQIHEFPKRQNRLFPIPQNCAKDAHTKMPPVSALFHYNGCCYLWMTWQVKSYFE